MSKPEMKKLGGGRRFNWNHYMPPVLLRPDVIAALRENDVADEWFELVADACWRASRADAIRRLKLIATAEAHAEPHVVDRRPRRLQLVEAPKPREQTLPTGQPQEPPAP